MRHGIWIVLACVACGSSEPAPSPQASPSPSGSDLRLQERARLPGVTQVERWRELAIISEVQNFAPGIVPLREGGYRMFWNDPPAGGITSAASVDGFSFVKDAGLRLPNGTSGDADCTASHPWLAQTEGGYRMYYQGNAVCNPQPNQEPVYRVLSAFSADGLTFEREGVRIDIGAATGLTQAAHGRVLRLADGTLRMYFSANFVGVNEPADILGATSQDGLTWQLDGQPILKAGHDPTVIQLGDLVVVYTTYLGDNFLRLESRDGYAFTPMTWLEFYDARGQRIEEFGDAEVLLAPSGRLLLYGSGKGSRGLGIYERQP